MPRQRYGDHNWRLLLRDPKTEDGLPQCLPRRTRYGTTEAAGCGLIPVHDMPDMLIKPADYKEVIADCHAKKIFAVYHQLNHGMAKGYDQDGYGFCWSYGVTMATMDCRALENQTPVRLSPFSLGWLTGWKNQGYYCDAAIKGARDKGIAPLTYVPEYELNSKKFKAGWEEEALKYRPLEWFDTNYTSEAAMVQQCISILATGRPLYVAFNWWGHALETCAVEWDEKQRNNVVWVLRNSHAESDVIELTGQRGVPDEAYGVSACSIPGD